MKHLALFDKALAYVETSVIVLLSSVALGLGVMQVVLRYVFNTGFPWNEAIFVTLTIWAMLFGGSRAVRDGVHVRVDVLALILPRAGARILDLIGMLASLALTTFFFYCGLQYTRFVYQMGIRDIETNVPDAVTYGIVPVAMAAFAIRYVILIIRWVRDPEVGLPLDSAKHGEGSA
ncbi:MAG: TRAP transporter small permease [Betaproteobacteria bacterium]|nr:TRAP transporter small permease [Betaproteobacteria bacterium]MDH3436219.1 TRAP transporter small permease [Betaproteobacteria bacterium]